MHKCTIFRLNINTEFSISEYISICFPIIIERIIQFLFLFIAHSSENRKCKSILMKIYIQMYVHLIHLIHRIKCKRSSLATILYIHIHLYAHISTLRAFRADQIARPSAHININLGARRNNTSSKDTALAR